MSDKPQIQNELSENLASLMLSLSNENRRGYIRNFWKIMSLEWNGLDRLRLNKFYFIMKRFVFHMMQIMKDAKFQNISDLMSCLNFTDESVPEAVRNCQIETFMSLISESFSLDEAAMKNLMENVVFVLQRTKKSSVLKKVEECFHELFQKEFEGLEFLKAILFEAAASKEISDKNRTIILGLYSKCPGKMIEKLLNGGTREKRKIVQSADQTVKCTVKDK